MQTMLSYYQSIKSDVDTAIKGESHPVGALALVCAAVSTFCILFLHVRLSNLQVGHALRMCQGHSALVPAQQLSTVGVSRPRQPTLQEDSARLSLYKQQG